MQKDAFERVQSNHQNIRIYKSEFLEPPLLLFGIEMVNDVEHHEALHTVIPVVAGVFGTGPGVGTAALVENV